MAFLRIFFLAGMLSAPFFGLAQDSLGKTRLEAGIGFPVFHAVSNYDLNVLSFSLKMKHAKNVIRTGVNFTMSPSWYTINLGYERILFGESVQCFAGIDAGYSKMPMHDGKVQTNYGIGPVIGFWYNFQKRYFFQAEYGWFQGPRKIEGRIPLKPKSPTHATHHRALSFHLGYIF